MRIEYLLALVLLGCASGSEPIPVATKPEPDFTRHITSKTHLLYTYKLQTERGTGYELAEADAEQVCQSKWGLHAWQRDQPNCGSYNTSAIGCAITFQCR